MATSPRLALGKGETPGRSREGRRSRRPGVLFQADGEGFYDGEKLILETGLSSRYPFLCGASEAAAAARWVRGEQLPSLLSCMER